ncbi:MAG: Fur family transcriptional regulator [Chlamydiota bacterium]|nr:Fur family transcriptional regulator [Chlamydiota bacterium]
MIETQFMQYLKSKDLKMTRERRSLFEGVKQERGHFSVDTLVYQLKQRGYKVSRDTVYRNLPLLLESGVIRQSFRTGRDTMYEVVQGKGHHDHVMCRKCGKIVEFVDDTIEKMQEKIAQQVGFKLEYHCHQLVGLCKKCQTT